MESMQFEITNNDGKKIICEVIATYHDDNSNKDFIVYTDKSFDDNKKLNLYYSLYEKQNNSIKLIDITNAEDKKIGLEIIKELVNDIKS